MNIFIFLLCGLSCTPKQTSVATERNVRLRSTLKSGETPRKTIHSIYGKSHAVVIGIDDYRYDSAELPDLNGAVADAKAVAKELSQNRGFTVDVFLNNQATLDKLNRYFINLPQKVGPNDRLLVYFAGHGISQKLGDKTRGYLLPHDARIVDGTVSNSLWMRMLQMYLSNSNARHILYIADACYSGMGLDESTMRSAAVIPDRYQKVAFDSAHIAISAGGSTEKVKDAVPCPDVDEDKHGLFTCHFLSGLRQGYADHNNDGVIQSSELIAHVENMVREQSGGAQNPRGFRVGDGDFLFANPQIDKVKEKISQRDMVDQLDAFDRLLKATDVGDKAENQVDRLHKLFYLRAAYSLVKEKLNAVGKSMALTRLLKEYQSLGAQETPLMLLGHEDAIIDVDISSDSRLVVTASADRTARIWDLETGQPLKFLMGHEYEINIALFSPDNRLLMTGGKDKQVYIWDVHTGEQIHKLSGHSEEVIIGAFSPDGQLLVTGGAAGFIKVWDLKTGKAIQTITDASSDDQSNHYLLSISFSPDSKRIVTGTESSTAKVWDVYTGTLVHTLSAHDEYIFTALFSTDNRFIITGSGDHTAKVWNAFTGELLHELKEHQGYIHTALFSSNNRFIVTASGDNFVRVWDGGTGSLIHKYEKGSEDIHSLSLSQNGEVMILVGKDGKIRVWELESGDERTSFELDKKGMVTVSLSRDLEYVVVGYEQGYVDIWSVGEEKRIHKLMGSGESISAFAFNKSKDLLVTGSGDSVVKLWDVKTAKVIHELKGHQGAVTAVAISPDDRFVATGSHDTTARVWSVATGQLQYTIDDHEDSIFSVSIDPNNQLILTASDDNTVRLWDIHTGAIRHVLKGKYEFMEQVYFSPRGTFVVMEHWKQSAVLWHTLTGWGLPLFVEYEPKSPVNPLQASGQRIYDHQKELSEIFLELGKKYALRPCPIEPYKMISVQPHPDARTAFVPEELVKKYCQEK